MPKKSKGIQIGLCNTSAEAIMKSTIDILYDDVLENRHLVPCEPLPGLNPIGSSYQLLPEYGTGYCWEYMVGDMLAVSIIDQTYYKDQYTEIQQPDYLTLGYYESVSGEVLTPYRKLYSGTIHAHVGVSGIYSFIHHANFPVRGISFTIMPEYYEDHLKQAFGDQYVNPKEMFAAIDGVSDFYALNDLFYQVKAYIGSGMAADMFYRAKLEEAIALVLEEGRRIESNTTLDSSAAVVPEILSVASYIDDHYDESTSLDFLARIACMSKTRLMQRFKSAYRCTIHQYQQNKRISHAESLLRNTDLSIAEIAGLVGYKNQGSFSEVYKRNTGISPKDYRKSCKRK